MQLKTHHKIGITLGVAILIIAIAVAASTAVVVYHHYHISKGSTDMPAGTNPPEDSVQTGDSLSSSEKHTSMSDAMPASPDVKSISGYHTDKQIQGDINTWIANHPGQGLVGIVHIIAKHKDGTVFADFKEHNTRTVQGIGCFGTLFYPPGTYPVTNTTNVCPLTPKSWGAFNVIALINGSHALTLNGSDKPDNSSVGNKCCDGKGAGTRGATQTGLIYTFTNSAQGVTGLPHEGNPSQGTVANSGGLYNTWTISSGTYTFSETNGMTVRGAMLVNSTTAYPNSPVAYAENAFTPITLAPGDSLTLVWTVSAS